MLCLYTVGRTAHPLQCASPCPYRQKLVYTIDIDKLIFSKELIPIPGLMEAQSQLRRQYRFVGYYQIHCTEWNLLVDETKHYIALNHMGDITDLEESIGACQKP